MKSSFFTLILLVGFSFSAFSQEEVSSVEAHFLIEGGIEFGGDDILEVFFTNGESQTITAGQGGYISVGGQLDFSSIDFLMLRGSVGIKYVTTAADNANIRLTRIPINLTAFWKITDDIRLGVGGISYQGIKLNGDGFLPDTQYTSPLGAKIEFGYKWAALTYTMASYEDPDNQIFSANSIGFSFSFLLPQ